MFDYYKINTLRKRKIKTYKRNFFFCSLLNYTKECVCILDRFFIEPSLRTITKEGVVPTVFYKCSVGNKALNL